MRHLADGILTTTDSGRSAAGSTHLQSAQRIALTFQFEFSAFIDYVGVESVNLDFFGKSLLKCFFVTMILSADNGGTIYLRTLLDDYGIIIPKLNQDFLHYFPVGAYSISQ